MDDILTSLYDSFYTRPEMVALKQSVEANRALLRDRLPAEQRKLVLRIVDDLTMMTSEESQDSFLCGFKLAWRMANELNYYDDRRSTPAMQAGLGPVPYHGRRRKNEKINDSPRHDRRVWGAVRPCVALERYGQKSTHRNRNRSVSTAKRRFLGGSATRRNP